MRFWKSWSKAVFSASARSTWASPRMARRFFIPFACSSSDVIAELLEQPARFFRLFERRQVPGSGNFPVFRPGEPVRERAGKFRRGGPVFSATQDEGRQLHLGQPWGQVFVPECRAGAEVAFERRASEHVRVALECCRFPFRVSRAEPAAAHAAGNAAEAARPDFSDAVIPELVAADAGAAVEHGQRPEPLRGIECRPEADESTDGYARQDDFFRSGVLEDCFEVSGEPGDRVRAGRGAAQPVTAEVVAQMPARQALNDGIPDAQVAAERVHPGPDGTGTVPVFTHVQYGAPCLEEAADGGHRPTPGTAGEPARPRAPGR